MDCARLRSNTLQKLNGYIGQTPEVDKTEVRLVGKITGSKIGKLLCKRSDDNKKETDRVVYSLR